MARLRTAALLLATVLALVAPSSVARADTTDQTATTTGFQFVDITAADGVVLKANVIAPTAAGKHPAIVFISSWGLNDLEYLAQAQALAQAGYVVLSYTTRGFWDSGGEIDTAGPKDIADVSSVLDWVVANTAADPAHLGVAGVSYGAGIGLIAAGHDTRIRAVAAMSGWTDLVASLYGNQTRRPQAVFLLEAAATLLGRPSAEFTEMVDDYFANRDVDKVIAWGKLRSAATYLDAINASKPAILMANSYGDSLFPPNQLVDFYGRLTGPKRLEFAPGDHVVAEATGLAGLPNQVWTSVRRWFDQYLAGQNTGIGSEPPVVLRIRGTGSYDSWAVESYPDWAGVTGSVARYGLGAVRWWDLTGPLDSVSTGWSASFSSSVDTVADGGVVLLTNGLEGLAGIPPTVWLPAVVRTFGSVWLSDTLSSGAEVRGIGKLHLTVTPRAATGTVVCYLYDVDALGTGTLIAHAPISWTGASVGVPLALDAALPATAWNVPAGHRLSLVVDGKDPLYLDANSGGATITVAGPSWVDLPLR
jgi:cephalosporin-C deacetylase-like acetyl esterase